MIPCYIKNYFERKIISIHFYHNMIFIYKGNNDEGSTSTYIKSLEKSLSTMAFL